MKRLFLVLILLAFMPFTSVLHAQAPKAVTLQSVLRDAAGRLIANRNVSVLISLRRGSNTGPVVYSETHTPTTNQNGLYTVFFGRGIPVTGTFAAVDWALGPYYATVEADPTGGSNYTLTVSHPIVSVPYALFADTAAHAPTAGNAVHAVYADTAYYYKEEQTIRISHDTIFLSGGRDNPTGGSFVKLPHDSILMALDSIINHPCRTKIGSETQSVCDSYTWLATGETYGLSGTYRADFPRGAANGCDSVAFLYLTIRHTTNINKTENASSYYFWEKHNKTYTVSGTYREAYTNAEGCASVDSLFLSVSSAGTLAGVFSVSATKKVRFSKGNLQFKASTREWKFADKQYHFIGDNGTTAGNVSGNTNKSISSTYSGWIDLFGWGTSRIAADACDYYPEPWAISTSALSTSCTTSNYYGYGPSTNVNEGNLTGGNADCDWGVPNSILNGGNTRGIWRTLTMDEWKYLFSTRSGTRYCTAKVCGYMGIVLFPDGYTHTTDVNIVPALGTTNSASTTSYTSNVFDETAWDYLESVGCVFLPMAGYRSGTSYYNQSYSSPSSSSTFHGRYWSSSKYNNQSAYALQFRYYTTSTTSPPNINYNSYSSYLSYVSKYIGCSVRLVQDIN